MEIKAPEEGWEGDRFAAKALPIALLWGQCWHLAQSLCKLLSSLWAKSLCLFSVYAA